MAIKERDFKYSVPVIILLIIGMVVSVGMALKSPTTTQQERQYTSTIPARLVNQYLMVINGQLDQLNAKDYKELSEIIQPQIYSQYRMYVREDSVIAAKQKHSDSTKTKKP